MSGSDHERQKFQKANDEFTHAGLRAVLTIILQQPIMMMGITTVTALVLYFGGHMVLSGNLEVGTLSSIVTYIFNILISIMMLAMVLLQYVRASACGKRIFEVIDTVPSIQDGADLCPTCRPQGKVEFRNVRFKYTASGTGDDVLTDINFTAQPGQVLAVVGGTGVGKSSLVNLIPGSMMSPRARCCWTGWTCGIPGGNPAPAHRHGAPEQRAVLRHHPGKPALGATPTPPRQIIQAAKDAQAYDFIMELPLRL